MSTCVIQFPYYFRGIANRKIFFSSVLENQFSIWSLGLTTIWSKYFYRQNQWRIYLCHTPHLYDIIFPLYVSADFSSLLVRRRIFHWESSIFNYVQSILQIFSVFFSLFFALFFRNFLIFFFAIFSSILFDFSPLFSIFIN